MITRADVWKEIISPSEVEKLEEPKMGLLLYRAIYMAIRLLLDIRHNQVRISKGEKLELKVQSPPATKFDNDNPVIKKSDEVRFDNDNK